MARKLFYSSSTANDFYPMDCNGPGTSSNNRRGGSDGRVVNTLGWLPLLNTSTGNTPHSSINKSSTSVCSGSIWYNTITDALYCGAVPPTSYLNIGTSTNTGNLNPSSGASDAGGVAGNCNGVRSSANSIILADEMGVGKSLQILSLVLLMLQTTDTPSSTVTANTITVSGAERGEMEVVDLTSDTSNSSVKFEYITSPTALPSTLPVPPSTPSTPLHSRPCLCGSHLEAKNKSHRMLGWIQCSACRTWLHGPCAGFDSTAAMEQCAEYTCLACSALHHYALPLQARTTLIVMPNTLIHQWRSEMLKHLKDVSFGEPDAATGKQLLSYLCHAARYPFHLCIACVLHLVRMTTHQITPHVIQVPRCSSIPKTTNTPTTPCWTRARCPGTT